jgi:hypothetical protein
MDDGDSTLLRDSAAAPMTSPDVADDEDETASKATFSREAFAAPPSSHETTARPSAMAAAPPSLGGGRLPLRSPSCVLDIDRTSDGHLHSPISDVSVQDLY